MSGAKLCSDQGRRSVPLSQDWLPLMGMGMGLRMDVCFWRHLSGVWVSTFLRVDDWMAFSRIKALGNLGPSFAASQHFEENKFQLVSYSLNL